MESVALVALVVESHDDDENMTKKVVPVELVVRVDGSSVVAVVAVVEAVHERAIGQLVDEVELVVGHWCWIDMNVDVVDVDEKDSSKVEVEQL